MSPWRSQVARCSDKAEVLCSNHSGLICGFENRTVLCEENALRNVEEYKQMKTYKLKIIEKK